MVPNLCECAHAEASARIRGQLDLIDKLIGDAKTKEAIKEVRKVVAAQEQQLREHMTTYRSKYERNMMEFVKTRAIRGELQTSAWKEGDLKRLRDPSSAAAAAAAAGKKKPKVPAGAGKKKAAAAVKIKTEPMDVGDDF